MGIDRRELMKTGVAAAIAPALPALPVAAAVPSIDLKEWAINNGYAGADFFLSDGIEDYCSSCSGYDDDAIAAGTPMVSYRCSYEYDEWEMTCLKCLYEEWLVWENMSEEDLRKMAEA